ncbi:serine-rich adhesin for platelets [Aplysia californica]|uniref:Serine-rich adhesin for platelets n=1 Tax=Aplysia californica TaxID=6500 RepID=A0ABM0JX08_APLCA|nr:serine-rich adhesin for platelets [Aplysia californica]
MSGREMKAELTCPICMELFRQPRRLPCGHSYCHVCIKAMLESKAVESGSYFNYSRPLVCPECRDEVNVDFIKGIEGLPVDFKLSKLVDLFQFMKINDDSDDSDQRPPQSVPCPQTPSSARLGFVREDSSSTSLPATPTTLGATAGTLRLGVAGDRPVGATAGDDRPLGLSTNTSAAAPTVFSTSSATSTKSTALPAVSESDKTDAGLVSSFSDPDQRRSEDGDRRVSPSIAQRPGSDGVSADERSRGRGLEVVNRERVEEERDNSVLSDSDLGAVGGFLDACHVAGLDQPGDSPSRVTDQRLRSQVFDREVYRDADDVVVRERSEREEQRALPSAAKPRSSVTRRYSSERRPHFKRAEHSGVPEDRTPSLSSHLSASLPVVARSEGKQPSKSHLFTGSDTSSVVERCISRAHSVPVESEGRREEEEAEQNLSERGSERGRTREGGDFTGVSADGCGANVSVTADAGGRESQRKLAQKSGARRKKWFPSSDSSDESSSSSDSRERRRRVPAGPSGRGKRKRWLMARFFRSMLLSDTSSSDYSDDAVNQQTSHGRTLSRHPESRHVHEGNKHFLSSHDPETTPISSQDPHTVRRSSQENLTRRNGQLTPRVADACTGRQGETTGADATQTSQTGGGEAAEESVCKGAVGPQLEWAERSVAGKQEVGATSRSASASIDSRTLVKTPVPGRSVRSEHSSVAGDEVLNSKGDADALVNSTTLVKTPATPVRSKRIVTEGEVGTLGGGGNNSVNSNTLVKTLLPAGRVSADGNAIESEDGVILGANSGTVRRETPKGDSQKLENRLLGAESTRARDTNCTSERLRGSQEGERRKSVESGVPGDRGLRHQNRVQHSGSSFGVTLYDNAGTDTVFVSSVPELSRYDNTGTDSVLALSIPEPSRYENIRRSQSDQVLVRSPDFDPCGERFGRSGREEPPLSPPTRSVPAGRTLYDNVDNSELVLNQGQSSPPYRTSVLQPPNFTRSVTEIEELKTGLEHLEARHGSANTVRPEEVDLRGDSCFLERPFVHDDAYGARDVNPEHEYHLKDENYTEQHPTELEPDGEGSGSYDNMVTDEWQEELTHPENLHLTALSDVHIDGIAADVFCDRLSLSHIEDRQERSGSSDTVRQLATAQRLSSSNSTGDTQAERQVDITIGANADGCLRFVDNYFGDRVSDSTTNKMENSNGGPGKSDDSRKVSAPGGVVGAESPGALRNLSGASATATGVPCEESRSTRAVSPSCPSQTGGEDRLNPAQQLQQSGAQRCRDSNSALTDSSGGGGGGGSAAGKESRGKNVDDNEEEDDDDDGSHSGTSMLKNKKKPRSKLKKFLTSLLSLSSSSEEDDDHYDTRTSSSKSSDW